VVWGSCSVVALFGDGLVVSSPTVRRGATRDFFVSAGSRPRGTNVVAINAPQIPIDQAAIVEPDLQGIDDLSEDTFAPPLREVVVHGLPRTEPLG